MKNILIKGGFMKENYESLNIAKLCFITIKNKNSSKIEETIGLFPHTLNKEEIESYIMNSVDNKESDISLAVKTVNASINCLKAPMNIEECESLKEIYAIH